MSNGKAETPSSLTDAPTQANPISTAPKGRSIVITYAQLSFHRYNLFDSPALL
jgi:hypothetical protein